MCVSRNTLHKIRLTHSQIICQHCPAVLYTVMAICSFNYILVCISCVLICMSANKTWHSRQAKLDGERARLRVLAASRAVAAQNAAADVAALTEADEGRLSSHGHGQGKREAIRTDTTSEDLDSVHSQADDDFFLAAEGSNSGDVNAGTAQQEAPAPALVKRQAARVKERIVPISSKIAKRAPSSSNGDGVHNDQGSMAPKKRRRRHGLAAQQGRPVRQNKA
jgi:hypothetical protein